MQKMFIILEALQKHDRNGLNFALGSHHLGFSKPHGEKKEQESTSTCHSQPWLHGKEKPFPLFSGDD